MVYADLGFPTEQIGDLAKQGAGWVIALALAWVVWHLWRDHNNSLEKWEAERGKWQTERETTAATHEAERATWWQARLVDWKEIATLVREQNTIQTQLTAARETGSSAMTAMAEAGKLQAAVLGRLIETVDRAIISTENLKDAILKGMVVKS